MLEKTFTDSKMVNKCSYDTDDKALIVDFKYGTRYKYLDVPRAIWDQLIVAPSIGSFINQTIKPQFKFVKL